MKHAKVLTISEASCFGGDGIQADLKTFDTFGCYGASVITAIASENSRHLISVNGVLTGDLEDQLRAVFEDISFSAVKLGLLPTANVVNSVAEKLKKYKPQHIVCDPVLLLWDREILGKKDLIPAYVEKIFPLAEMITPNIHEAEMLTGLTISNWDDVERAAEKFREMGARSVIIKGGQFNGQAADFFLDNGRPRVIRSEYVDTDNTFGSGSAFSSAIAAGLANGRSAFEAVNDAKRFVYLGIKNAFSVSKRRKRKDADPEDNRIINPINFFGE